jgi:hypothetical protein
VEVGTNTTSKGKGEKQDGGDAKVYTWVPIAFFITSRLIWSNIGVRLSACAAVETRVGTYGGDGN